MAKKKPLASGGMEVGGFYLLKKNNKRDCATWLDPLFYL